LPLIAGQNKAEGLIGIVAVGRIHRRDPDRRVCLARHIKDQEAVSIGILFGKGGPSIAAILGFLGEWVPSGEM
jgi:hypothetical protein